MSTVSLACGLPCFHNSNTSETKISISLRITILFLGIISTCIGGLLLLNTPCLSSFGTAVGWSTLSFGLFLELAGLLLKVVKNHSVQKSYIQHFPKVIHPYINDILFKRFPVNSLSSVDLKKVLTHPLTLFQVDQTFAIGMKLKVEHFSVDETYTPCKNPSLLKNLPSSQKPFTIYAVAWQRWIDDTLWILDHDSFIVEHRKGLISTETILGLESYSMYASNQNSEEYIKMLKNTAKQDKLDCDPFNLEWILLRLLNNKSLELRELPESNFIDFAKPVLGYWKISLAD
jgi:hypothetical protein